MDTNKEKLNSLRTILSMSKGITEDNFIYDIYRTWITQRILYFFDNELHLSKYPVQENVTIYLFSKLGIDYSVHDIDYYPILSKFIQLGGEVVCHRRNHQNHFEISINNQLLLSYTSQGEFHSNFLGLETLLLLHS